MYKSFQQCQNKLDGIQAIDYFLAKQLCQAIFGNKTEHHSNDKQSLLFHSVMATSRALREGHSCLKLSQHSEQLCWFNPDENKPGYQFPSLEDWCHYLSESAVSPETNQPLVFEQSRLYLRRYWQFENQLASAISALLNNQIDIDINQGRHIVKQLFPGIQNQEAGTELDWQKIAVANALGRQLSIIAGGPGTGKTFTVTKVLAALQALSGNDLRIVMVAPTGKAAQRLNESIQKAKSFLSARQMVTEDTLSSIPDTASTLHRLLGVLPGSHNFRFNETRKLPFDVVLVDEVSMIDLPLMTRLLRAISAHCRIIMLGDAEQLPSVAAGSVLSDLAPQQQAGVSALNSQQLSALTGFDIPISETAYDHLTVLQKSHRFDGGGEIGLLSRQVIGGDAIASWHLLANGQQQILLAASASFIQWLEKLVDEYYVPLFAQENGRRLSIQQAFEQLNKFRFLAAVRLGEQGVNQINDLIEQYLKSKGLITARNEYYPGRPIMVTENHYHVGLYNGDTGLLWLNEQGKLQAAFPQNIHNNEADSESIRWLSIGRLPAIETVYAMTIHKTQGSEFSHVALVLPQQDSPILSRELLYTGITRASDQLTIWSDKAIFELAVKRKIQRYSGLKWRIFGSE